MNVTQVTGISKSRYRIYLDGEFAFILYRGEMKRFHIAQGQELSEEDYRQITEEILTKRAKMRCMNLLQSKDYTQRQLEDKLRQGEYPAMCIEEALAYVKSYGYIDDMRYAKACIEDHMESRSRTRIKTDLLRKGIAKDIIETAFAELEEAGARQDEGAMIQALFKKKNYVPENATKQEQQRMYGFLYRRGFKTDAITRALLLDITSNSV